MVGIESDQMKIVVSLILTFSVIRTATILKLILQF